MVVFECGIDHTANLDAFALPMLTTEKRRRGDRQVCNRSIRFLVLILETPPATVLAIKFYCPLRNFASLRLRGKFSF